MKQVRRDCGINMKIVPYGSGWTDVYMDFGAEELYFIISHCLGNNLTDFMRLLYHMFPQHDDPEQCYEGIEYKYAVNRNTEDGYKTERIVDNLKEIGLFTVYHEVPWKVSFEWNEEGSCSIWNLEREPNENTEFMLYIDIKICRSEERNYHYEVPYKDFCYAFSKAYTEMLKKHGFFGYHKSVYSEDVHMRYFLFLKAYALNCLDMLKLTYFEEKGEGERSSLENELELLLFDM